MLHGIGTRIYSRWDVRWVCAVYIPVSRSTIVTIQIRPCNQRTSDIEDSTLVTVAAMKMKPRLKIVMLRLTIRWERC